MLYCYSKKQNFISMYVLTVKQNFNRLSSISISFVKEPELEHSVHKLTTETFFVAKIPLSVDDFEGDVFIRRTGSNSQCTEFRIL